MKFAGRALFVVLGLSTAAYAQIGSGWSSYSPSMNLQLRGCGAHSASGGVETFRLTCSSTSGDNRAEQRIQNDYTSGTNQFEGEVRVVSLGGSNISLKQTFMPNDGAFLMIAVASGGRLYSVGNSGDLATGIVGSWLRLNTIHDVGAGTHRIYVNGSLRYTKTGGRQVAWHDKYGTYRLGSGHGPITAEWRNVHFWRNGSPSGGTNPTPTPAPTATPNPQATATPTPTPTGVPPTPTPCSGCGFSGYYRLTPRHSGKAIVVQSASTADNAAIIQFTYGGANTNDEWEIVSIGSGYYRVMNRNSGKALAVSGGSTASSTPLVQRTYGGSTTDDEWQLNDLGTGYYGFVNRNSGKAMDVKSGSTSDNAVVQQSTWSGVNQQQYQIVSVP